MDDPTQASAGLDFLRRLRPVQPPADPAVSLPPEYQPPARAVGLVDAFVQRLASVGGGCRRIRVAELDRVRDELGAIDLFGPASAMDRADPPEVGRLRGGVASAEDAAIYVPVPPESDERALPWLCEHLVVELSVGDIVADLHAAFAHPRVKADLSRTGFSVWISGPSKTADIEQTLVMGAHGPSALTVLLVEDA